MPGRVSSARLISMSRSGYFPIFRKIVGAHSLLKIFENFLTPTKKDLTRIFACLCVWVNESFRLVCFLTLFAKRLRSKITFKILGVDFDP